MAFRRPYSELSDAGKKHTQFRNSLEWKLFKRKMSQLQDGKCAVSGRVLTAHAALHHLDLDPEHYEQLTDESHFVYLSHDIHDAVHTLYKCPVGWRKALENISVIMQRMDELNGLVDGKPAKDKSR